MNLHATAFWFDPANERHFIGNVRHVIERNAFQFITDIPNDEIARLIIHVRPISQPHSNDITINASHHSIHHQTLRS